MQKVTRSVFTVRHFSKEYCAVICAKVEPFYRFSDGSKSLYWRLGVLRHNGDISVGNAVLQRDGAPAIKDHCTVGRPAADSLN